MRPPLGAATGSGLGSGFATTSGSGSGSGVVELGGGGVGLPAPGVVVGEQGAAVSAGSGINKYCPSRTVRLPSKLFHSARR